MNTGTFFGGSNGRAIILRGRNSLLYVHTGRNDWLSRSELLWNRRMANEKSKEDIVYNLQVSGWFCSNGSAHVDFGNDGYGFK